VISLEALTRNGIRVSIMLCADSMPSTLPIESPSRPQPNPGRSRIVWMGAATIAIALVLVMWPSAERLSGPLPRETHLPFGSAERAYAPNLQIDNIALSRAENFLNQEVTTLAGRLTNAGNLPLSNVEITVEFSDEFGQVVLRESRAVFASQAPQLTPGDHRNFEISFEHIPTSWNIQKPAVRVSGILFSGNK
jgi:hypothetical protein